MTAHLMASTLVALVAIAAALAMRSQAAAWRHAILLIAVLRFALPTGWLAAAGPHLPAQLRLFEDIGPLLLHPGAAPAPAASIGPAAGVWSFWWMALWALGSAFCFGLWARRALRPVPAVRPPTWEESQAFPGVPLRIVAADHVPGACGFWKACVVLPDGLSLHLNADELRAVVEHEMAHVRRRDNLWAAAVHAVVSAFWFHPLLWWMERRLLAERETACDEMVLAQGVRPEAYISGIAKVCRMSFTGDAAYAGVTGSNLRQRMEHIMSASFRRSSSRFVRAAAAALIAVTAMLPLAGGFAKAQAQAAPQNAKDGDFERGVERLGQKAYADAYEAFRRFYQAVPSDTRGIMGMAETLMAQNRGDEAVALLQEEARKNPANRNLAMGLGNLLVRAGKYDQALDVFKTLLAALDPKWSGDARTAGDVYLRMGEAWRRKGNDAEALTALGKAKELMPDNVSVLSTIALTIDHMGDRPSAIRAYREVLKLNPENGIGLNNLAYALIESGGDADEALNLALHAERVLPQTLEVKDTLGWVHLKRNELQLAVDEFRQAVEGSPADAAFRSHLALALDRTGDTSAAVVELKTLLRATPSAGNQSRIQELLQTLAR